MITKIKIDQVACYKKPAILETDKRINLIYGLNGTGKSTLSDFLYNSSHLDYKNCSIEGINNEEILVYNQSFIKDYFYQPDSLKSIFTLSKENKKAEETIRETEKEIESLIEKRMNILDEKELKNSSLDTKLQDAENHIWKIKTEYTGGDRVLEFCLSGLMGRKNALFTYLMSIAKPEKLPDISIKDLKKEVEAVKGTSAQKYNTIEILDLNFNELEIDLVLNKEIVGNENSTVSELIKKLGNSDWVKLGLNYIPETIIEEGERCPFCQEKTITKTLIENIENYFDESYNNDLKTIQRLLNDYQQLIDLLPKVDLLDDILILQNKKMEYINIVNDAKSLLNNNLQKIEEKKNNPSKKIVLKKSANAVYAIKDIISTINNIITEHNKKIDNIENTLKEIKDYFWKIMRWNYSQILDLYNKDVDTIKKEIEALANTLKDIDKKLSNKKTVIIEQQKNTVNIQEAIDNINSGLIELGIDGFAIEKHTETLYKIERKEHCEDTFESLSEGEKMIISFLYFRELFKGKKSSTSVSKDKIVVIDDPISSLSHIYVFNVGQMIKNDFFNSPNCSQIILLTHSLYFFYEMTDTNHSRRKDNQKLYRMVKNSEGTTI